jgi:hypothetical protein
MKKLIAVILFAVMLTVVTKFNGHAGNARNNAEEVIEKIVEKYKELRETAPVIKAKGKTVSKSLRFIQPEDKLVKDFSKLKQIALVRHGEPDMVKTGKYNSDEAMQFVKCYDSVCIIVPDQPFFELAASEDVKVFSSPINRALSTAQYLCGKEKDITTSPDFREFESNMKNVRSKKRLPIKLLNIASRAKWMLGIGNNEGVESFSEAKLRAERAAEKLAAAAEENPKVLLTAHGFLNRYIKKNLKKMGWKVVEDTGSNYFGTTILVKIEE